MEKIAIHMVEEEDILKIAKFFNKPLTYNNCFSSYYLPDLDRVMPVQQVEMWHPEYRQIQSSEFIKLFIGA